MGAQRNDIKLKMGLIGRSSAKQKLGLVGKLLHPLSREHKKEGIVRNMLKGGKWINKFEDEQEELAMEIQTLPCLSTWWMNFRLISSTINDVICSCSG